MSKLLHFKGAVESARHGRSLSTDANDLASIVISETTPKSGNAESESEDHSEPHDQEPEKQPDNKVSKPKQEPEAPGPAKPSADSVTRVILNFIENEKDIDLIKEKFGKLLLGEDMSGGGKGVASALALSNAITNLAASVFGEQRRLEPMPAERKARWRKEVDWLLSVTDYIVEFVPQQKIQDGKTMEVMVWKQRKDLQMNIPALRKLDNMLLECLENFKGANEFYYVKHSDEKGKEETNRKDEKWWLPTVKVPPEGLSDMSKKFLQHQKDSVTQVHKAAMAINAQVISEMDVPEGYMETLPKNGRASLGDAAYKSITVETFDPDQFLSSMDMSSEHKIVDLKNRIEASIVIWKRKMTNKDGKSTWSGGVGMEKRELFEERAETVLLLIKHRYPGISQSSLDISKIQFNRDVGQACLESYSRVIESLAYTVLSRIEDVLIANREAEGNKKSRNGSDGGDDEAEGYNPSGDGAMTLLDFMRWGGGSNDDDEDDGVTEYIESLSGGKIPAADE